MIHAQNLFNPLAMDLDELTTNSNHNPFRKFEFAFLLGLLWVFSVILVAWAVTR